MRAGFEVRLHLDETNELTDDIAEVERFVGLGAAAPTTSSMEGCVADLGRARCQKSDSTDLRTKAK